MKTFLTFVLLTIPTVLLAGTPAGTDQGNMQNMMQMMQQVQECMAKIDQSQMEQLMAESEKLGEEVEALCDAGKRDKAQKLAIKFGKEIASSPVMKQMRTCGEIAQGAVPMMEGIGEFDEDEFEGSHVCDE